MEEGRGSRLNNRKWLLFVCFLFFLMFQQSVTTVRAGRQEIKERENPHRARGVLQAWQWWRGLEEFAGLCCVARVQPPCIPSLTHTCMRSHTVRHTCKHKQTVQSR